jgi:hypothetical protein
MKKRLWKCPKCGEEFTTKNQWHSCGRFNLDDHFKNCQPQVRALFDRFVTLVEECGPVKIIPQKTRIVFQTRMRFAAIMTQKTQIRGHLVLAEPVSSDCFEKVETYSPRNHVHVFRISDENQFNDEFVRYLNAAYNVGNQNHLDSKA